ncbi:DNA-formamidopyrimidine glycosylase family protein [Amycolatopsis sp. NPDC004625]|uniref:DNA-formamidopyrimidine glycosylase family protein n=1 Tax=Amycolatopsis sp. NPDC004625 TaxID=3154670 RepID=UPI0033BC220C
MPEGDTVYLVAKRFATAMTGKTLLRGEFRVPQLATVDLAGRKVLGVGTVGKHLFTRFSGDLTLHSHLMMDGMWDVYPAGAKWRRPGHHARVIFTAADVQVIGFRVHDLKLVATHKEHDLVAHLGPDVLDPQWTEDHLKQAVANLTADPAQELGIALLDQRVLAGVGNLYKCEIAFLLGVTPWTPVSEVDAEQTVTLARRLLLANARSGRFDQSTTGHFDRNRKNWVYERTRQGCFRCGGKLLVRTQGHDVRRRPTWFCPKDQTGPYPAQ